MKKWKGRWVGLLIIAMLLCLGLVLALSPKDPYAFLMRYPHKELQGLIRGPHLAARHCYVYSPADAAAVLAEMKRELTPARGFTVTDVGKESYPPKETAPMNRQVWTFDRHTSMTQYASAEIWMAGFGFSRLKIPPELQPGGAVVATDHQLSKAEEIIERMRQILHLD